MSLIKRILFIALSMPFHGAIISMQTEDIYEQKVRIAQFIHEEDHNPQHIALVGRWLTEKRNNVSDYEEWEIIINFVTSVGHCRCDCLSNKITYAIQEAVKQVARNLQPGQDCSQLLVDHAQAAIVTAMYEWHEKKIINGLQELCIK
jgi:hypothetical protein